MRLTSDVLADDGAAAMTAVSSATLAFANAGIPLSAPVAGENAVVPFAQGISFTAHRAYLYHDLRVHSPLYLPLYQGTLAAERLLHAKESMRRETHTLPGNSDCIMGGEAANNGDFRMGMPWHCVRG